MPWLLRNRKHAARICGAAVAGIVPYLMLAWATDGPDRFSRPLALAMLAGVLFGVLGWWAVQSWQLLCRQGRNQWERLVYNYGVRGFGLSMAVITVTALGCWGAASGDGTTESLRLLLGGVYFGAILGLPVWLHVGYFWGATAARLTGIPKP